MINHFRTLLLNLSYAGNNSEHIPSSFVARQLPDKTLTFYQTLFPTGSSRARILELGQVYLELIEATRLSEVITAQDPRVTYVLETDFQNFKQPSINLNTLFGKFTTSNDLVSTVLAMPKKLATDTYDNYWLQHPNKIYKLAGLIAAYVIRLS